MSSTKSFGPFPFSVSIASITSREFPTALPSGCSILVRTAVTFLPALFPIATIFSARSVASSTFFINAPSPTLTSRTIPSEPEASFLLIIELAIKDVFETVAVVSRSA